MLILSQFVRDDGCILPARVTGLCKEQQKRISYLIAMAQKAGKNKNNTLNKIHFIFVRLITILICFTYFRADAELKSYKES